MTYTAPNHYSHKFKLDTDNLPTERTDKIPAFIAFWGLFCGALFVALGAYEIIAYFLNISDESYDFALPNSISLRQLFVLRYSFDTFILLLGLAVMTLSALAILRRKKIYFDGQKIKILHKSPFHRTISVQEDLYNYLGVLLKVEYYQFGLMTRNRYIIELYHKEKNKRIPLYISTKARNVRQIWEQYAQKLKMPALFMTDHGLVSKHHNELNKTLKEMSKRWHLEALYREEENIPATLKYSPRKDKVIFKEKRAFFDIYTILLLLSAVLLGSLCVWSILNYGILKNYVGSIGFSAALSFCSCLTLAIIIGIFSTDVLIIKNDRVILGHNLAVFRSDIETLPKEEIESVDIGHNPITDRYYLSIIAHQGNIIFGKNMPIDDLRWIRGCVIREIVK